MSLVIALSTPPQSINMADIIPLKRNQQEQVIIDRLKELLIEAEEGNLSQIAFVGLFNDGSLMECITVDHNMYELLGGLNVMQQRVTQQMIENVYRENVH